MKIKYCTNFQLSSIKEDRVSTGPEKHLKEINCFPVFFSLFDLVTYDKNYSINFQGFKPVKFPMIKVLYLYFKH